MTTITTPVDTDELSPQERKGQARDLYLLSLAEGAPLSGKALAARFGRSERWGRKIIAEARGTGADDISGSDECLSGTRTGNPTLPNGNPRGTPVPPKDGSDGNHDRPSGTLATGPARRSGTPDPAPTVEMGKEAGDLPGWIDPVTRLSVALVALAAAVWSVDHLASVSRLAGTTGWKVWLLPGAVDGLASTASLVLYRAHRLSQRAGPVAWLAFLTSLAASVAGNIVATYPELVTVGPLKVAVGATPPLSLALALHLLLHQSRPPQ